jgi:hypothetical protein
MKLQKTTLGQIPRLLSLLDRNKNSSTYGCFDRTYWHYKEKDVPNAEFQEAVLALALLYRKNFPGNVYFKKENILEWLNAAMSFWAKIQNEDGSFNESYSNEYSYVATAFSTYAVSEALIQIRKFPPKILKALKLAGQWLMENKDLARLPNHESGAVAALYNIFRITKKNAYEREARKILSKIIQSPEGWFDEYGGADIGYQSLSIDFLAKYYISSKDEDALGLLNPAVEFISYFIHPDGTSGGEYGSRSTEWIFPHGFKLVSKKIPVAGNIFVKWMGALDSGKAVTPDGMDDRYFVEMLNNLIQTQLEPSKSLPKKSHLPCDTKFKKYFPEAKFFVVSNENYYSIFSGKGTLSIYSKVSPFVLNDCGFIGKLGKKILTSNWLDQKYDLDFSENEVIVKGRLHEFRQQFFSPHTLGFFKIFTSTAGKNKTISFYMKRKMIGSTITKSKTVPVRFQRKVTFNRTVKIEDSLEGDFKFDNLLLGGRFSLPYVTFSKYFLPKDLDSKSIDLTKKFNSTGRIKFNRIIDMKK